MRDLTISEEDPLGGDLELLFQRHTDAMHADTPPGSIHMMDAARLAAPGIRFFVARDAGTPLAMGAFKDLGTGEAELKSMHVLTEARGRGLAHHMLDHLTAMAAAAGMTRLYLETGSQPSFEPARALYRTAGFEICAPFGDYAPDPNSCFMTKSLR